MLIEAGFMRLVRFDGVGRNKLYAAVLNKKQLKQASLDIKIFRL